MIPPTFDVRRGYVATALLACFVALCVRLAVIQVLHHPAWAAKAEAMESDLIPLDPQRGHILDRNGRPVAVTTACPSVWANPRAIPSSRRDAVAARLAEILDLDKQKVGALLSRQKYFVWIKRKVTPAEVEAVEHADLPGVAFREESRRRYPLGPLLCHVLGFVGTDGQGLAGIEARFEHILHGVPGHKSVLRDGLGRRLAASHAPEKPAVDGWSLVLTIDMRMQSIVEEELAAACAEHRPESACAIVMDPCKGDVLAMAVWPAFDPERFQESPAAARGNMAVMECLEPGSTFKPFVASAALEFGVVTPETVFHCHNGRYAIGSRVLHDAHGYGRLSVRDIVAYSSNIGMAQIGARLGGERIHRALDAFGFGRRSGIELPGETPGILREPVSSLRRADAIVLTRVGICSLERVASIRQSLAHVAPAAPVYEADHTAVGWRCGNASHPPEWIAGKRVLAFCGLGNPRGFEETVRRLGADIATTRRFPDHYWYDQADIEELMGEASELGAEALVTTEKDAVRLPRPAHEAPWCVLEIEMKMTRGEAELRQLLHRELADEF